MIIFLQSISSQQWDHVRYNFVVHVAKVSIWSWRNLALVQRIFPCPIRVVTRTLLSSFEFEDLFSQLFSWLMKAMAFLKPSVLSHYLMFFSAVHCSKDYGFMALQDQSWLFWPPSCKLACFSIGCDCLLYTELKFFLSILSCVAHLISWINIISILYFNICVPTLPIS